MKQKAPRLSVVVPVFNEADSLAPLLQEISEVFLSLSVDDYEIVLVDDGSTDDTPQRLQSLKENFDSLKVIRFRRNFGKSAAMQKGFEEARGDVVVTLDGDLQDDPHEIPVLLRKLEEGYDLVSGWKTNRQDPFLKKISSKFFNRVTASMTGIPLHDFNCGMKCYRREVVKELRLYGQLHRFIAVLAHQKGFRVSEAKVRHRARKFGKTKFGPGRYVEGFLDLLTVLFLTQYLKRPLHFLGRPGLITGGLGVLICSYLSLLWFMGQRPIGNRPLLFLGILLILSGIQFFCVGLLGELIVHHFHQGSPFLEGGGEYASTGQPVEEKERIG